MRKNEVDTVCEQLGLTMSNLGVMVVDHGSRRQASNDALHDVVTEFRKATAYELVEPAHMELAEPSIRQAFTSLVTSGAKFVAVHPYFLLPGRHWDQDIPQLVAEAAAEHAGVDFIVTSPLGIHSLMAQIMNDRIVDCLNHRVGKGPSCAICDEEGRCHG